MTNEEEYPNDVGSLGDDDDDDDDDLIRCVMPQESATLDETLPLKSIDNLILEFGTGNANVPSIFDSRVVNPENLETRNAMAENSDGFDMEDLPDLFNDPKLCGQINDIIERYKLDDDISSNDINISSNDISSISSNDVNISSVPTSNCENVASITNNEENNKTISTETVVQNVIIENRSDRKRKDANEEISTEESAKKRETESVMSEAKKKKPVSLEKTIPTKKRKVETDDVSIPSRELPSIDAAAKPAKIIKKSSAVDVKNAARKSSAVDVKNVARKSSAVDVKNVTRKSSAVDVKKLSVSAEPIEIKKSKTSATQAKKKTSEASTSDEKSQSEDLENDGFKFRLNPKFDVLRKRWSMDKCALNDAAECQNVRLYFQIFGNTENLDAMSSYLCDLAEGGEHIKRSLDVTHEQAKSALLPIVDEPNRVRNLGTLKYISSIPLLVQFNNLFPSFAKFLKVGKIRFTGDDEECRQSVFECGRFRIGIQGDAPFDCASPPFVTFNVITKKCELSTVLKTNYLKTGSLHGIMEFCYKYAQLNPTLAYRKPEILVNDRFSFVLKFSTLQTSDIQIPKMTIQCDGFVRELRGGRYRSERNRKFAAALKDDKISNLVNAAKIVKLPDDVNFKNISGPDVDQLRETSKLLSGQFVTNFHVKNKTCIAAIEHADKYSLMPEQMKLLYDIFNAEMRDTLSADAESELEPWQLLLDDCRQLFRDASKYFGFEAIPADELKSLICANKRDSSAAATFRKTIIVDLVKNENMLRLFLAVAISNDVFERRLSAPIGKLQQILLTIPSNYLLGGRPCVLSTVVNAVHDRPGYREFPHDALEFLVDSTYYIVDKLFEFSAEVFANLSDRSVTDIYIDDNLLEFFTDEKFPRLKIRDFVADKQLAEKTRNRRSCLSLAKQYLNRIAPRPPATIISPDLRYPNERFTMLSRADKILETCRGDSVKSARSEMPVDSLYLRGFIYVTDTQEIRDDHPDSVTMFKLYRTELFLCMPKFARAAEINRVDLTAACGRLKDLENWKLLGEISAIVAFHLMIKTPTYLICDRSRCIYCRISDEIRMRHKCETCELRRACWFCSRFRTKRAHDIGIEGTFILFVYEYIASSRLSDHVASSRLSDQFSWENSEFQYIYRELPVNASCVKTFPHEEVFTFVYNTETRRKVRFAVVRPESSAFFYGVINRRIGDKVINLADLPNLKQWFTRVAYVQCRRDVILGNLNKTRIAMKESGVCDLFYKITCCLYDFVRLHFVNGKLPRGMTYLDILKDLSTRNEGRLYGDPSWSQSILDFQNEDCQSEDDENDEEILQDVVVDDDLEIPDDELRDLLNDAAAAASSDGKRRSERLKVDESSSSSNIIELSPMVKQNKIVLETQISGAEKLSKTGMAKIMKMPDKMVERKIVSPLPVSDGSTKGSRGTTERKKLSHSRIVKTKN